MRRDGGAWLRSKPGTQGNLENTGTWGPEPKTKAEVVSQEGKLCVNKEASGDASRREKCLNILGKLRFESRKEKRKTSPA